MSFIEQLAKETEARNQAVRDALEKRFPTFGAIVATLSPGEPGHPDMFTICTSRSFSRKNFNGLGLTEKTAENPSGDYVRHPNQHTSVTFTINAAALEKALKIATQERGV